MQCAKKNLMLHAPPETEGHLTLQIIISVRNIVCGITRNKKKQRQKKHTTSQFISIYKLECLSLQNDKYDITPPHAKREEKSY